MQDADFPVCDVYNAQTTIASDCVILEAFREIELEFFSTDTGFELQK